MRIAISAETDNGLEANVSPHFGRCPYYTFVEVADGQIASAETIANPHYPNHVPGAIPEFIHSQKADVMLTGGMGYRAVEFFQQFGIQPVTGAGGNVREAVQAFVGGQISGAAPCHESTHGCGDEHHGEHHGEHHHGG